MLAKTKMATSVKSGYVLYDAGDYVGAISAFRSEAANGSVIAIVWLGYLHEIGKGAPLDLVEAERYYRQATDAGSGNGPHYLGNLLLRADRTADAVAAFEIAASRGFSPAIYRLGALHEHGHGVPKDEAKAEILYREAAKFGNLWARRKIAVRMMKGVDGVLKIVPGAVAFAALTCAVIRIGSKDVGDPRLSN